MRDITNRLFLAFPLLLGLSAPLHADLTGVDIFKNIEYIQTSGSAPISPSLTFVSLSESMANPGDFDSASVTYPGPASPQSLALVSPTFFAFQTGAFPDQATMDTAYPFGAYIFTANNSSTSSNNGAIIDYTADAYTSDIPAFTAATFAALQNGVYNGAPFTFNFNSFTPNAGATVGVTFLSIFGSSYSQGFPSNTTSATIPAYTLKPGTTYTAEIDFSDRVLGTDSDTHVPTLLAFDVRTDVNFTTLTPEPGSLGLGVLGMAALAFRLRRRTN